MAILNNSLNWDAKSYLIFGMAFVAFALLGCVQLTSMITHHVESHPPVCGQIILVASSLTAFAFCVALMVSASSNRIFWWSTTLFGLDLIVHTWIFVLMVLVWMDWAKSFGRKVSEEVRTVTRQVLYFIFILLSIAAFIVGITIVSSMSATFVVMILGGVQAFAFGIGTIGICYLGIRRRASSNSGGRMDVLSGGLDDDTDGESRCCSCDGEMNRTYWSCVVITIVCILQCIMIFANGNLWSNDAGRWYFRSLYFFCDLIILFFLTFFNVNVMSEYAAHEQREIKAGIIAHHTNKDSRPVSDWDRPSGKQDDLQQVNSLTNSAIQRDGDYGGYSQVAVNSPQRPPLRLVSHNDLEEKQYTQVEMASRQQYDRPQRSSKYDEHAYTGPLPNRVEDDPSRKSLNSKVSRNTDNRTMIELDDAEIEKKRHLGEDNDSVFLVQKRYSKNFEMERNLEFDRTEMRKFNNQPQYQEDQVDDEVHPVMSLADTDDEDSSSEDVPSPPPKKAPEPYSYGRQEDVRDARFSGGAAEPLYSQPYSTTPDYGRPDPAPYQPPQSTSYRNFQAQSDALARGQSPFASTTNFNGVSPRMQERLRVASLYDNPYERGNGTSGRPQSASTGSAPMGVHASGAGFPLRSFANDEPNPYDGGPSDWFGGGVGPRGGSPPAQPKVVGGYHAYDTMPLEPQQPRQHRSVISRTNDARRNRDDVERAEFIMRMESDLTDYDGPDDGRMNVPGMFMHERQSSVPRSYMGADQPPPAPEDRPMRLYDDEPPTPPSSDDDDRVKRSGKKLYSYATPRTINRAFGGSGRYNDDFAE